jgi:hypothetical protein
MVGWHEGCSSGRLWIALKYSLRGLTMPNEADNRMGSHSKHEGFMVGKAHAGQDEYLFDIIKLEDDSILASGTTLDDQKIQQLCAELREAKVAFVVSPRLFPTDLDEAKNHLIDSEAAPLDKCDRSMIAGDVTKRSLDYIRQDS